LIGFAFAAAAVVSALGVRAVVEASCNAVPTVERRYASTNGLVNRRLVLPWTAPNPLATPAADDRVEIELPQPCASGALFGPGVTVEIRFRAPVPGATATPSWLEVTSDRLLRFTVPDAGRSGPVDVVVLDGANKPIAEVGPLHQATTSCDLGPADPTFAWLTVLPPANDVHALAAGKAPLVMTVDGTGALLVPLAHPFPVATAVPLSANAIVAYLERGSGHFGAFGGQTKTLAHSLRDAAQPADDAALSDQLVRTFTEHGRPLPTLVHLDAQGALWGSVDAPRSVLRVAPHDVNASPIHDFANRLGPDGRIVVTPRPTPSSPFAVATSAPFLLQDLRAGAPVVAWVRDERIEGDFDGDQAIDATRVVTVRAARAGRDPGFELRSAVRDGNGRALLGTARRGGAYLGSYSGDRGTFRAYALPAGGGAPAPVATPAHLRTEINRRSLAISEPLAFFGKFQTGQKARLQSYDIDAAAFADAKLPAFDRSVVGRGCALALAAADHQVWWYCRATGNKGPLGVHGDAIALADRFAVVAARPSPSPGVVLHAIKPGGGGTSHRIPQAASAVAATAFCDPGGRSCDDAPCAAGAVCRRLGLFLAPLPSPSLGTLTWVAEPTPGATPAPVAVQPATDFVARGGIVAFRAPRATGLGKELFVLDLRQDPPRLCSTGSTATAPGAVDWENFYEIRGREVLFLTDEREEGQDLDGDDKTDRVVLQMFDAEACSDPSFLGVLPPTAPPAPPIGAVVVPADVETGVLRASLQAASSTLFADEEGDQVPYPFDRCAVVANPRQIDDDLDGLGDGAESCDPTYCTPYRPPPVRRGSFAARRCVRRLRPAAERYFDRRAAFTDLCLPTAAGSGNAAARERRVDRQCLGAFANLTENRPEAVHTAFTDVEAAGDLGPQLVTAVRDMLRAEDRLGEIAAAAPCDDPRRAARLVRAEAGAIAALTRAAMLLGLQGGTARAAIERYVRETVDAMEDCLARCRLFPPSGATLAAQCLGHIAGAAGSVAFVPPTHAATAQRLAAVRDALFETLAGAECASGGDRRCGREIACLGWRRAVDVVLATR
jgi:hypothetical protein